MPPLAFTLPVRVEIPVTPKVPPKAVAPVPTLKVLLPLTEVAPLRVSVPVPVETVPVPDWEILPASVKPPVPAARVAAEPVPATLKLPVWAVPGVAD